jgi:hypothetical protein
VYEPVADRARFEQLAYQLLDQVTPVERGVRLLGVTLSSLVHNDAPTPPGCVRDANDESADRVASQLAGFVQTTFDF